jgi:hypothetical protein
MNANPISRAVHLNCNCAWMRTPVCFGLLLALCCGACNWGKKAPECKVLVSSLNELSATLAGAHTVLSAADVQPMQVVETLKPFSEAAKKTARTLNAQVPTVSKLRAISAHAAAAALAIGSQSAQLAEYASQMIDMDAANRAVDENKQRADKLEAELKKTCEAEPSKCVELSQVLARFPAPAEQTEVDQDIAVWTGKLSAWAVELSKVRLEDAELRQHVEAFRQTWLETGVAMSRLVAILEVGKKYEALNRDLNTQIERANQAIAEANESCEK